MSAMRRPQRRYTPRRREQPTAATVETAQLRRRFRQVMTRLGVASFDGGSLPGGPVVHLRPEVERLEREAPSLEPAAALKRALDLHDRAVAESRPTGGSFPAWRIDELVAEWRRELGS